MEQLKKTSTPQFKECRICGLIKSVSEFCPTKWTKDGYRSECKKCKYIHYTKPHLQTQKGKETRYRYEQSEKGKGTRLKYRLSEHGRIVRREGYNNWLQKNKTRRREINLKYYHSETFKLYRQTPQYIMSQYRQRGSDSSKAYMHQYNLNRREQQKIYQKERYYKLQDDASYHLAVDDWYPGYRIIKALEKADVIEI